jgi:hypothetical protein
VTAVAPPPRCGAAPAFARREVIPRPPAAAPAWTNSSRSTPPAPRERVRPKAPVNEMKRSHRAGGTGGTRRRDLCLPAPPSLVGMLALPAPGSRGSEGIGAGGASRRSREGSEGERGLGGAGGAGGEDAEEFFGFLAAAGGRGMTARGGGDGAKRGGRLAHELRDRSCVQAAGRAPERGRGTRRRSGDGREVAAGAAAGGRRPARTGGRACYAGCKRRDRRDARRRGEEEARRARRLLPPFPLDDATRLRVAGRESLDVREAAPEPWTSRRRAATALAQLTCPSAGFDAAGSSVPDPGSPATRR